MRQGSDLRVRLTALGFLAAALFNFPLLALPSGKFAGLPAGYVWIFGVWATLIGAAALLARRGD